MVEKFQSHKRVKMKDKRVIKLKLWQAIFIFVFMSAGVVCMVLAALNFAESMTKNRIHSGIVDGIRSKQGKFWLNDNISIRPTGANKGEISIAGAGDNTLQSGAIEGK